LQRQFGILAFWYPGIRAFWQSGNIYPLDSSQNRWATETENGKLNTAAGKLAGKAASDVVSSSMVVILHTDMFRREEYLPKLPKLLALRLLPAVD